MLKKQHIQYIRDYFGLKREFIRKNLNLLLGDRDERAWFFQPRHRKKIERFKDKHVGEDCFIIATGTSLNKIDVSLLNNYHTFGLNKIYLLFDKVKLDLSYYVATDKHVIPQSQTIIEKLSCPSFISFEYGRGLIKDTDKIHFLLTKGGHYFSNDLRYTIAVTNTVSFVALQLAYYMGFQNVYLVGYDHHYTNVTGPPESSHFLQGKDESHFDSRYFANQIWVQPDLAGMEVGYHLAKYYFELSGRKIYNATVGGQLEVFPRIRYEYALRQAKRKSFKLLDTVPA